MKWTKRKSVAADVANINSIRQLMKVFDQTLTALKDSGNAPVALDGSEIRWCPKAKEPVYSQLVKVEGIWHNFVSLLEKRLSGNDQSIEDLAKIKKMSVELLTTMDKAVTMMQVQAEGKVSTLLIIQFACIALGIAAMVYALFTVMRIVARLNQAKHFANDLGQGNLTVSSQVVSNDEIGLLGKSLDENGRQFTQDFFLR